MDWCVFCSREYKRQRADIRHLKQSHVDEKSQMATWQCIITCNMSCLDRSGITENSMICLSARIRRTHVYTQVTPWWMFTRSIYISIYWACLRAAVFSTITYWCYYKLCDISSCTSTRAFIRTINLFTSGFLFIERSCFSRLLKHDDSISLLDTMYLCVCFLCHSRHGVSLWLYVYMSC